MKKIAVIFICLLFAAPAFAENYFQDADILDLHIKSVYPGDNTVIIADKSGNVREVMLGDSIGIEKATVIEIEKAAIVVDRGEYETRIPAVFAVGKSLK